MTYPVGSKVFISRQSPVLSGCVATIKRVLPYPQLKYLCETRTGKDAMVLPEWIGMGTSAETGDPLLYMPDAAQRANCSLGVLHGAIRSGRLDAVQEGRYYRVKESDLNKWIETRTRRDSVAAGRGKA